MVKMAFLAEILHFRSEKTVSDGQTKPIFLATLFLSTDWPGRAVFCSATVIIVGMKSVSGWHGYAEVSSQVSQKFLLKKNLKFHIAR